MAVITAITAQVKKKDRCNIYVDHAFYCGLQTETVLQYRLKVGSAVTAEELEHIQLESERLKAFDRSLDYLSKSPKTRKQIAEYLKGKGYLDAVISYCLEKLDYYGYVDDTAYAKAYVAAYGGKKGELLLRNELRARGCSDDVVACALAETENRQLDGAIEIAKKYCAKKTGDPSAIRKTYRYLLSKGYSYEICKQAIGAIGEEACEEF